MNHKRKRPKDRRAGCLMCKYWKSNGLKGKRRRATGDSVTRQEARANISFRHQMKAVVFALLLATPLAAQEPTQDSVTANAALTLMLPAGTFTVVGDTTLVENALTLNINIHDLTTAQREQMAQAAGQAVVPSEGFDWFRAGILVIGAGAVLAYYLRGETTYTFINEQGQTVTVNQPCWPRSYGKDKPPVRCEDDE